MLRLNDILEKVATYNPSADLDLLRKAYVFSAKAHKGQVRLSGEPYLTHPMAVADILADLRLDVVTVAAGLLHDALEDTLAIREELEELFGQDIANLVEGLTKISKLSFVSRREREGENFRRMMLAMARDIRIIMIKLADRLHNLRTLEFLSEDRREAIAQETLDIYAPLAQRLGINEMKSEFEDLALRHLKPEIYYDLVRRVAKNRREREAYIAEVKAILEPHLAAHGIAAEVRGRPKHFYSIYTKMESQHLSFDQIYDLLAFRIIVGTVKDCYEALGHVHSLWKPVPGRFKDYLAVPKANRYQSLHSTVIGPRGERVEVQIRTHEMHRVAEVGIAAHWKYKEGGTGAAADDERVAWLRQLVEWQQEFQDSSELLETVKVDLFADEVYVFTPKGDVKALPAGATPIDFAYAIHTDVGHHCAGAKVNGRLVPLKYALQSGESVEILTSPGARPSRDWLKIVRTGRARSKIRQWIRVEEREQSLALGREICEKEFKKQGLSLGHLLKTGDLEGAATALGLKTSEDLLAAVGYGKISAGQVLSKVLPPEKMAEAGRGEPARSPIEQILRRLKASPRGGIAIKGVEDLLVRFARCCNPVVGDPVVGFITRGRGVTVHRDDCPGALTLDPERRIEAHWDASAPATRVAKISVVCEDKIGLLADLSSVITSREANICQAHAMTTADRKAVNTFEIAVHNVEHLRGIMRALEKVKGVIKVERLRG